MKKYFVRIIFCFSTIFLFLVQVYTYESIQTLNYKTQIASLEQQILSKNNELENTIILSVETLASVNSFALTASEAERLANNKKTVIALKFGLGSSGDIIPAKALIDFLINKFVEQLNNASFDIQIQYKVKDGEIPEIAKTAFLRAKQYAREHVSKIQSEEAIAGRELEQGTDKYVYHELIGYAKGLLEEKNKFQQQYQTLKTQITKLKSELDNLKKSLLDKKNLLSEQQKSDDLYLQMKTEIEKQKMLEEERQRQLDQQTYQQIKSGITDASAIDLSTEIQEMETVANKLKNNAISYATFETALSFIVLRAKNKTQNVSLVSPKGLSEKEEVEWKKQQYKILDSKLKTFLERLKEIENSLEKEKIKHIEEIKKIVEEANKIFYKDNKDVLLEYKNQLETQVPKFENRLYQSKYTRLVDDIDERIKILKDMLKDLPKDRNETMAIKEYYNNANKKYNDFRKVLIKEYNKVVTKVNEYIKKNFNILSYPTTIGYSTIEYIAENDIKIFPDNYDELIKSYDQKEREIKNEIQELENISTDLKSISDKLTSTNLRYSNVRKNMDDSVSTFLGIKDTIKNMEEKILLLSKERDSYVKELEKIKENYIGIQILTSMKKQEYGSIQHVSLRLGDIASTVLGYIKEVDKFIDFAKEKNDPKVYQVGPVIFRYKKFVEEFKKEENVLRTDLEKYLDLLKKIKIDFINVYTRSPESLITEPNTSKYFTKSKIPRFDNDKFYKELNSVLSIKKTDFNYFNDYNRDFIADETITNLRNQIVETMNEIYKLVGEIGIKFEPAKVISLYIDNQPVTEGTKYDTITIYRKERQTDNLDIKLIVDRPQNVKDVELSVDGGITYKRGILDFNGKEFIGSVELVPNKTVEIKLKINQKFAQDYVEHPRFGKGFTYFYSTEDPQKDIEEMLQDLIFSYETKSQFSFMKNISENFVGQYENMQNAIKKDFSTYDNIRMKLYIDNIVISPGRDTAMVDVRWERSWTNVQTNNLEVGQLGSNKIKLEKVRGKWKILAYYGTPMFGTAVISLIDNPTGGTFIKTDLNNIDTNTNLPKLPVYEGRSLRNHTDGGYFFSFNNDKEYSVMNDSVLPDYELRDLQYKFSDNEIVSYDYDKRIYAVGIGNLDSVIEAPTSGYEKNVPAIVGYVYVFKCANGNYAKFKITSKDATKIIFDYVYQPDGSKNLR